MKAIMMSIKPQHVCNILNNIKWWEIRKKFPKDYVGWVYIYCTKGMPHLVDTREIKYGYRFIENMPYRLVLSKNEPHSMNGKVVARFWCDKVEEHKDFGMFPYSKLRYNKATCLNEEEIEDYGFIDGKGFVPLYAIHITKLEIFDEPKEINEFKTKLHIKGGCKNCPQNNGFSMPYCKTCDFILPLTRAPQSWCYVEV